MRRPRNNLALNSNDWLMRFNCPKLIDKEMKRLRAMCRAIEREEKFRPEGMDYPSLYWSDATIAAAYARFLDTQPYSLFARLRR